MPFSLLIERVLNGAVIALCIYGIEKIHEFLKYINTGFETTLLQDCWLLSQTAETFSSRSYFFIHYFILRARQQLPDISPSFLFALLAVAVFDIFHDLWCRRRLEIGGQADIPDVLDEIFIENQLLHDLPDEPLQVEAENHLLRDLPDEPLHIEAVNLPLGELPDEPVPIEAENHLLGALPDEPLPIEAQNHLPGDVPDAAEEEFIVDQMKMSAKGHQFFARHNFKRLRDVRDLFKLSAITCSSVHTLTIRGKEQHVKAAKEYLSKLAAIADDDTIVLCTIPQRYHNSIMGENEENVQQIARQHNVSVQFPNKSPVCLDLLYAKREFPDLRERKDLTHANTVQIGGRRDDCMAARVALQKLVPVYSELTISAEHHDQLIARYYTKMTDIKKQFGVTIYTTRDRDNETFTLQIWGPEASVLLAREALVNQARDVEQQTQKQHEKRLKEELYRQLNAKH